MNQNEYEAFRSESVDTAVAVVTAQQVGGVNKSLAFGYDVDRNSFHAYAHDGILYAKTYNRSGNLLSDVSGTELPAEALRPNKRVYPQYTDGDFARLMRDLDFPLPFTNWSEPNREGPYYGETHLVDDIKPG